MNMSAQGAGDGREDGTTRKIIVQHREEVREAVFMFMSKSCVQYLGVGLALTFVLT